MATPHPWRQHRSVHLNSDNAASPGAPESPCPEALEESSSGF